MELSTFHFVCNCLANMITSGHTTAVAGFWARYFPGIVMPAAMEVLGASEGTLITAGMVEELIVAAGAVQAIGAADAVVTLVAVEIEVDAAVAATTTGVLTEAEWLLTMRAAQVASGGLIRTAAGWTPQGRTLVIILAVGTLAVSLAAGSRSASAQGMPVPKKPESLSACMRSLYSLYLLKSFALMLSKPTMKYRMYKFDEWRVQVFHPMLKRVIASAPERERLREKAKLNRLIEQAQYRRPLY